MTGSEKKDLKIKIKGIGPLNVDYYNNKANSLNIALFATNGSGKTFISRCFDKISENIQGDDVDISDNLVSFDEQTASFEFEFSSRTLKNELKFNITKGKKPIFETTQNWILHVFNKEFIEYM